MNSCSEAGRVRFQFKNYSMNFYLSLHIAVTCQLLHLNEEEVMVTLHPRAENRTLLILSPLKDSAWVGGLLVLVVVMGIFMTVPERDLTLNTLLWYTLESIGQVRRGQKCAPRSLFAFSGNAFYLLWLVTIFFMICAYNVELRAKTIEQRFEKIPNSIYDFEFPRDLAITFPLDGSTTEYVCVCSSCLPITNEFYLRLLILYHCLHCLYMDFLKNFKSFLMLFCKISLQTFITF